MKISNLSIQPFTTGFMLKNITVPVDFSGESENALLFAAEIAKRVSARLTILHAQTSAENAQQDEEKLKFLKSNLQNVFGSDLDCETSLAPFDLAHILKSNLSTQKTHLIVMGTKGASGLKRILIGSNTVRVIAEVPVPILVIPGAARFEDFNKKGKNRVVFASDLEEIKNEASLDFLAEFMRLMIQPKLRILTVRPKNTSLNIQQGLQRKSLLSGFGDLVDTEIVTVFSSNVLDGIQFYLDKNTDTGMIVMISKDSGGLFQRHFTREMASVTHYPLLVLKEKD